MGKKRKTARKILSFLLTLSMVFSMLTGIMPGTSLVVKAAGGTVITMAGDTLKKGNESWEISSKYENYTTYKWLSLSDGTYQLQSDITTTASIVVTGTVTLDLNGYGITANNTYAPKSAITIEEGATLTLKDSGNTSHDYYIDETGLGHIGTTENGDLRKGTFTGGYITGGKDQYYGQAGSNSVGGGVFVKCGTFNMQGGTIIGNQSSELGGGVAVSGKNADENNPATFVMS